MIYSTLKLFLKEKRTQDHLKKNKEEFMKKLLMLKLKKKINFLLWKNFILKIQIGLLNFALKIVNFLLLENNFVKTQEFNSIMAINMV
jgi:hypothetical protein